MAGQPIDLFGEPAPTGEPPRPSQQAGVPRQPPELTCQSCGSHNLVTNYKPPHVRCDCADCGRFVKFISQK